MNFNVKHVLLPYDKYKKLMKPTEETKPPDESHSLASASEEKPSTLEASDQEIPGSSANVKTVEESDYVTNSDISKDKRKTGETLLQLLPPLKDLKEHDVILYTQTNNPPPEGFRKIIALLAESDVPLSLIENKSLRDILTTIRHLESESDSEEEYQQKRKARKHRKESHPLKHSVTKPRFGRKSSTYRQGSAKAPTKWVTL